MIRLSSMAVLAAGLTLSGCAVLKSPDPVQTYRIGAVPAFASSAVPTSCERKTVTLRRIDFEEASRGDRLLAVTGNETAFIGGARWIVSAHDMFTAALADGFDSGAPCIHISQGLSRDGLSVAVEVRRFETVYEAHGAVPDVHISVTARLLRPGDRAIIGEERFDVLRSAHSNRVSAIVAAYDEATAEAVRKVVEFTAQGASRVPAA